MKRFEFAVLLLWPVIASAQTAVTNEYADVLALQGTAKQEILAIARLLRQNPQMAIDRTQVAGEYCLKPGSGTMVHFATDPRTTAEDIIYEFDATPLIRAGLDPQRLPKLPARGKMTPGTWYFLPLGDVDPHHGHPLAAPTIVMAVEVK